MKIFFFLFFTCYLIAQQEPIHFVIITPSYNNSLYCEKNIHSLLSQDYPHFRIIYIDDASTDDTFDKVFSYVQARDSASSVTLIKNPTRRGSLANFYYAIHSCADNEVVVVVDGDDYLPHPRVLSKLASVYTDPHIWLTYGDFICYPSYKQDIKICKPFPEEVIKRNHFRYYPWISSHLRTFYAGLFKQIKLQDLLYKENFFSMAGDVAAMIPMLEMAGKRHRYLPDILYVYNTINPLSDGHINRDFQWHCDCLIRSRTPYTPIDSFISQPAEHAELIIFSFDRPMQLYALLESAHRYAQDIQKTTVIYRTSNQEFLTGYETVQQAFPYVHFIPQGANPQKDFKPLVMDTLATSSSPYVLFAVDDIILTDYIDIKSCIKFLKNTGAYGYYLTLSSTLDICYMLYQEQGIPPHLMVAPDIYQWQFRQGVGDWAYPNSLDLILYKKQDIIEILSALDFFNPNSMEALWAYQADLNKYGLFPTLAKAVNIPLNMVNQSSNRCMNTLSTQILLQKFQEGYKINIDPLFQIPHRSRHMEYAPEFIPR